MDKSHGYFSGAVVERFIKPRSSKIIGHPENALDGPGPSISVSVLHEFFFNSAFGIWMGGRKLQVDDEDQ